VIIKYVGLTAEASALIEGHRTSPEQAEWEIIVKTLKLPVAEVVKGASGSVPKGGLDLGQGVKLDTGERLYLFLSEQTKRANKPDGLAEIRSDGLYVDGKRIEPSRGTPLQPAMQIFQKRAGHMVSLSAWRQWHVLRDSRFIPLVELKDPALARRRGAPIDMDKLLAQLDAM
jgi:hypothetical protein